MDSNRTQTDATEAEPESVSFGAFEFDRRGLLLSVDGQPLAVTPKALLVLRCLIDRPGKVVRKHELMDLVWGDTAVTENSLVDAIRVLRQAMDDDPRAPTYIETVHRRGYRFIATVVAGGNAASGEGLSLSGMGSGLGTRSVAQLLRSWEGPLALGLIGLVVGVVAMWWIVSGPVGPSPVAPSDVSRLVLEVPNDEMLDASGAPTFSLSPDGRKLVYRRPDGLYVRSLSREEAQPVADAENANSPVFSPDGERVAFFSCCTRPGNSEGSLKIVRLAGGPAVTLVKSLTGFRGLDWSADGTILYAADHGLWQIPAAGGEPNPLPDRTPDVEKWWPQALPGGEAILVTLRPRGSDTRQIAVLMIESGELRVLIEDGMYGRYLASGHLVFARGTELLAVRYDPDRVTVIGTPTPVISDLHTVSNFQAAHFAVSATGTLVYLPPGETDSVREMFLVNRDGSRERVAVEPGMYLSASISPNGIQLLVAGYGGNQGGPDLSAYDLGNQESGKRLTFGAWTRNVVWSPRGDVVAFSSKVRGAYALHWMDVEEGAPAEALLESDHDLYMDSWSPDGRYIAYTEINPETGEDIWLLPLDGDGEPVPFLRTPFNESGTTFSPNGAWIAYHSDESGQWESYVRPVPASLAGHDSTASGPKVIVPTDCSFWPVWAPRGDELYFRHCRRTGEVWAVPVHAQPMISFGDPELLFSGSYWFRRPGFGYAVTPDGRFLMIERTRNQPRFAGLKIVLNWFEELKRLVPTGR